VKQAILPILLFFFSATVQGQGQYIYKPIPLNISLPIDTAIKGTLERLPFYSTLSDFEKGFLYSLNYARIKPGIFLKEALEPYLVAYPNLKPTYGESLIGDLKKGRVVGILGPNTKLSGLAKAHAADLGLHNLMSHRSSTGETTQQRYEKAGITCGSECINMANYVSPLEVLLSLLIDYNVPDFGHRKSLLNPKMTSVGVGLAKGTDGKIQYTVVDLGCM
jgi:hypothetical protein